MVELNGDFGTVPMNRLRKFAHARDELIITDAQLVGESPSPPMNVGGLNDD
ncbi:hypothetical protein ES703_81234 [subsurface metagenome]